MADEDARAPHPVVVRVQRVLAWLRERTTVRVVEHYFGRRGPLLSAGLSYQALFSAFAAIWVGFSVAGLVVAADPALRDGLLRMIANAVPGLIDRGDGGALDPDQLLSIGVLGWTGALALAGALVTAIGWLGSARDAVREIAQIASSPGNAFLLKLRDLGLAIGFGVALLISGALLAASTALVEVLADWGGVADDAPVLRWAVRGAGLALMFAFDAAVLATLYRVLAGVPIPPRPLVRGSLLGAAALGILKVVGSALLDSAAHNPLLASFAVIVGLLIWFNLACQVILFGAAWVVVTASDAGVPLDPVGERARRDAEARLRLEIEEEVRAELEAELPRAVRWLARRRRRRQVSRQN